MWCEKDPKRLKIATMYIFLPLVRTKASELLDFPGVNTPLIQDFSETKSYLTRFCILSKF